MKNEPAKTVGANLGVSNQQIRLNPSKMDGFVKQKPYFLMDDLGGKISLFSETSHFQNKHIFLNLGNKMVTHQPQKSWNILRNFH